MIMHHFAFAIPQVDTHTLTHCVFQILFACFKKGATAPISVHQLLAQCLNQLRIHSSHILHRGLAAELPIHCLKAEAVENILGASYDLKLKRKLCDSTQR